MQSDANWNVVGTATPNVTITASDSNAAIADDNAGTTGNLTLAPVAGALSSLPFKTAGTRTITAVMQLGGLPLIRVPPFQLTQSFVKLQLLAPVRLPFPAVLTVAKVGRRQENRWDSFHHDCPGSRCQLEPRQLINDTIDFSSATATPLCRPTRPWSQEPEL